MARAFLNYADAWRCREFFRQARRQNQRIAILFFFLPRNWAFLRRNFSILSSSWNQFATFFWSWVLSIGLLLGGCAQREIASSRKFSTSPIAVQPIGASNVWPNSVPAIRARYAILIDVQSG